MVNISKETQRGLWLYLCFLIFVFAVQGDLLAQGQEHINPRHATTYDWSVLNRIQLLDETHAYNEPFYDRGFGRVYNPQIKREYEIDMWMHAHQFDESYSWYLNPSGYRMRFGSYTKGRWAVYSELHTSMELSDNSDFVISVYPQQHARAERALVEFGYQHSFLGGKHKVSVNHTLTEFKQDLDLTFRYVGTDENIGELTFDFTWMNHMNNVVNEAGNDDEILNPRERQLQTYHETFPLFLFGRFRTPDSKFYHLDASFGWMPRRRDVTTDRTDSSFEYEQTRFVGFFNGSLGVRLRNFTVGVFYYADRDNLDRKGFGNPFTGEYDAEQKTTKAGGFIYAYFNRFNPFFRVSRERYIDRQSGPAFGLPENDGIDFSMINQPFDYFEDRLFAEVGVNIQPFKIPLFVELRYMSVNRFDIDIPASRIITEQWTEQYIFVNPHDDRFIYSFSFVASDRFHLELGAALDLDQDSYPQNPSVKNFDKGYGKIIAWF